MFGSSRTPEKTLVTALARLSALTLVTGLALLPAVPADAQRRILGADPGEKDEDAVDEKSAEETEKAQEKAKAKAEKKRKKAEAKKKKAAEKKRKAQEAAEEAAEAAELKAEQAAEKKKQQVLEKEQARLDANAASREKRAKKFRRISRAEGDVELAVTLQPGAPKVGKLVELRFDVARRLKVASVKFGNLEPQNRANFVVRVTPPDADDEDAEVSYRAHALAAPGAYGMHFTPSVEGAYKVTVEGKTKKGDPIRAGFAVYPGVWPPPDLEDEEKENKKAKDRGATTSGRRVVGD